MGTVLTVENTMNLIGHTVGFSEVLQSNMGYTNIYWMVYTGSATRMYWLAQYRIVARAHTGTATDAWLHTEWPGMRSYVGSTTSIYW